nr:hypothetical protein [Mycobacterium sp. E3298]
MREINMPGRKRKTDTTNNENTHQICIKCKKNKSLKSDYYSTVSNLYPNGNYPVCKACVQEKLPQEVDPLDKNYLTVVHGILLELNKPYLHSLWLSSIEEANRRGWNTFNCYMKNIQLNHKDYTWKNSDLGDKSSEQSDDNTQVSINFKVTQDILIRWGQNYTVDDYVKLEDFYHNMKKMNKIETPQEETYLKKLAVISVKMDQELESGNYGQVKQLGDLFSKYMADSKFRAMDKSEVDKTGGIRSFGAIFAECESEGHIPPWEQFRKIKGLTQDLVDKTIMHIENFTLRLNKIERMVEPPSDTPKITEGDV